MIKFQLRRASQFVLGFIFLMCTCHGFAQNLKTRAQQKGKYIGNILSIDGLNQLMNGNFNFPENGIIRNEFNALVLENDMKMGFVLSSAPNDPFNIQVTDFQNKARMDRFISYCKTDVTETLRTRGHALIWYSQAPGWLQNAVDGTNGWTEWNTQNIYDFSESYIKTMVTYFGSSIDEWDVFNEAFSDNSNEVWRTGTWYDKVASGTYNGQPSSLQLYFEMCFRWANEVANNDVALFYNDYNIEEKGNSKSDAMFGVIQAAIANGAPINGVGFQSHISESIINNTYMNRVVDRIRELGALGDDNDGQGGLKVAITELDIHSANANLSQTARQNAYWQVVSKTLAEPNVDELLVWGISDKDSWITLINSGYFGDKTGFLPWDANYIRNQTPGVYTGILDGLNTLSDANFPPAGLSVNWRSHGIHGSGADAINAVNAPAAVVAGSTVNVNVDYAASQDRDIIVVFQQDTNPWTTYQSVKTDVPAGGNSISISIPIPQNIPAAGDAYQFQVFITTNNGDWASRLDNQAQPNVDVIAASGQLIANGTYFIKKSNSNAYINATSAVGGCNNVQSPAGNASRWTFTHLGDDEYEIYNAAFNSSRLEVPYPQSGNGAPVATTNWGGNADNLVWVAVPVGNNFQLKPKHDQQRALDIWESNSNVVHLWGANTGNANQIFTLINASTNGRTSDQGLIVGDDDLSKDSSFTLYPNPAVSQVMIEGPLKAGDQLTLTTLSGKVIMEKRLQNSASQIELDVSSLAQGVYVLKSSAFNSSFLFRKQ